VPGWGAGGGRGGQGRRGEAGALARTYES
jgi:hypothetical protein